MALPSFLRVPSMFESLGMKGSLSDLTAVKD